MLQQPLDVEVGAGTMHPETFLRVLGPAHWNVAYVQPSRRPADGRFGENPNRLFKHHQFQVILKPAPDEVQQLYLDSLEACGINPRQHDIRFEEDNWESPTLGAWGIGWQVMFDGLEISQFTYFQQAGGIELAPISAELTYGLERIAMVLQRVDSMYDLEWAPGVKYGDVRLREEIEQSKYVFGQVDMPPGEFARVSPRPVRALLPASPRRCSQSGLIWPALEHCLKCSHLFNILDSSNSIGVTERTAYILRVRQLAVGDRQGLRRGARRRAGRAAGRGALMDRELLLEIGCEELPASWLPALTNQIGEVVVAQLRGASARRAKSPAETYSTPRRLTVRIARVPERQTDLEELVNGPPVSAAFKPRRHADAGRRRLRRQDTASRSPRSSGSRRRRATYLAFREAAARARRRSTCCPTCSAARCAGCTFPKAMHWDAMLEDGTRRAAVRPADPLDAVPVRRPRRAVHDRADAGGADRPGAGRRRPAPSPTATAS